jgi:hypothetical protein
MSGTSWLLIFSLSWHHHQSMKRQSDAGARGGKPLASKRAIARRIQAYAFVVVWIGLVVRMDEDVPVLHLVIGNERFQHRSRLQVRCVCVCACRFSSTTEVLV